MMKILIPLDSSKLAETMLPRVARIAKTADSEITLVTVVKDHKVRATWIIPPSQPPIPFDITGGRIPGIEPPIPVAAETLSQAFERIRAETTEHLQDLAKRYCPSARVHVLFGNDVAREILTYARRNTFDMIALAVPESTTLPGFFMQFLTQRVSRKLITSNRVPVLLVRHENRHYSGRIEAWQAS